MCLWTQTLMAHAEIFEMQNYIHNFQLIKTAIIQGNIQAPETDYVNFLTHLRGTLNPEIWWKFDCDVIYKYLNGEVLSK